MITKDAFIEHGISIEKRDGKSRLHVFGVGFGVGIMKADEHKEARPNL